MKRLEHYTWPLLPFVLGWILLATLPEFSTAAWINLALQAALFIPVVCIPVWRTGRISYVDIGWPLGVALIGIVVLLTGDGYGPRVLAIAAIYLFVGLRMGSTAVLAWRQGFFSRELKRYQYQRVVWERIGIKNTRLVSQVEAANQGLANLSIFAFPAFVIAINPSPDISFLEIAALALWALSFALETVADKQKQAYAREAKRQGRKNAVCDVGLWRYTRHPNYFAEWMVWNSIILGAAPSWWALKDQLPTIAWVLLGCGLLFTSRCMYRSLVHLTGATPSEYYSVQKRPDYARYQQTTSMFVPTIPRKQR